MFDVYREDEKVYGHLVMTTKSSELVQLGIQLPDYSTDSVFSIEVLLSSGFIVWIVFILYSNQVTNRSTQLV
jgi:hypothetical protein